MEGDLLTLQGNALERADDFEYLGSWINNTEHDMKIRRRGLHSTKWMLCGSPL